MRTGQRAYQVFISAKLFGIRSPVGPGRRAAGPGQSTGMLARLGWVVRHNEAGKMPTTTQNLVMGPKCAGWVQMKEKPIIRFSPFSQAEAGQNVSMFFQKCAFSTKKMKLSQI